MRMKSTQMKTRKTTHNYSGFAYGNLKDLIEIVDGIISRNPEANLTYENFRFDYESDYDDQRYVVLEYELPETEKERLSREKKELEQQKYREEYERKQFEALKKKYGTSE